MAFNEPFDLQYAIEDATHLYRKEAQRRNIKFEMDLSDSPRTVIGDVKKIRTVVQNLTANARPCFTLLSILLILCTDPIVFSQIYQGREDYREVFDIRRAGGAERPKADGSGDRCC